MSQPDRLPNVDEQAVLDGLIVRLIAPAEKARWDQLITEKHYLKNASLVGEQLRYVAEYQGQWLALLGWSAPALHLKARDQWVGWTLEQRRVRLPFLAQNSRFLVLGERLRFPNLASRALALCGHRLSQDWLQVHGHPIVGLESFVDAQLFRGTAYKASGWTLLGPTSGFGRCAQDFYQRHERPKQLWVRALEPQGLAALRAPELPEGLRRYEQPVLPRCGVRGQALHSLLDCLPQVADPRGRRGRFHRWPVVLAILCLAKLAGVAGAQREIAQFAQRLTQRQRKLLGCRRDPKTQRRRVPGPTTFFRALRDVPYLALEEVLLDWQKAVLGPEDPEELVVLDGKSVRGAGGQLIINAVSVPSGRVHGVERVQNGSDQLDAADAPVPGGGENEIPAVRRLLERADLAGRLVSVDAMHTQHQTAAQIVLECGADYLMTLKGNQPTLTQSAQTLVPGDFFPSGPSATGPDAGKKPGPR